MSLGRKSNCVYVFSSNSFQGGTEIYSINELRRAQENKNAFEPATNAERNAQKCRLRLQLYPKVHVAQKNSDLPWRWNEMKSHSQNSTYAFSLAIIVIRAGNWSGHRGKLTKGEFPVMLMYSDTRWCTLMHGYKCWWWRCSHKDEQ